MKKAILLFGVFFLMFSVIFVAPAVFAKGPIPFYFKPLGGKGWQGKGFLRMDLTRCGHRYLEHRFFTSRDERVLPESSTRCDLLVYFYVDHGAEHKIFEKKIVYGGGGSFKYESRAFFADDRKFFTDDVMKVLFYKIEHGQLIFRFGKYTRIFPFGCSGHGHQH